MTEYTLIELKDSNDIKLFKMLMNKYHSQGWNKGLNTPKGKRYFILLADNYYWVAGAFIHLPSLFRSIFETFLIPADNSYFLRRICKFAPGDYCITLLDLLCQRLKEEGKDCLVTLGLERHSNALYKRAGFQLLGYTARKKAVFVKWLRRKGVMGKHEVTRA